MEDDLKAFLARAAAEPFVFGEWDCAMTVANWVRERTGEDPATELRGTYSSDAEWQAIVAREAGLSELVDALAFGAGMSRTAAPGIGDIGVVHVPTLGDVVAIKGPRGWVMKLNTGLTSGPARVLAAWGF